MTPATKVGISVHDSLMVAGPGRRRRMLDLVSDAGIDYASVGDHISFHGGTGFDGMVAATSVLCTHDTLPVVVGIYLLGLRHPMLGARQLASISQLAPGRLVLGVGVAGEDRSEISNSGVDRRPAADGSTRRWTCCTGWPSAAERGRDVPGWYGLSLWCGLDRDPGVARDLLAHELTSLYRLPYDKFQHVTPAGTPAQVAEWLVPFVGHAEHINLIPAASSPEARIDYVAEVREHLRG